MDTSMYSLKYSSTIIVSSEGGDKCYKIPISTQGIRPNPKRRRKGKVQFNTHISEPNLPQSAA